jgi:hypothetical protein
MERKGIPWPGLERKGKEMKCKAIQDMERQGKEM